MHRDFETIFSGVAAARQKDLHALGAGLYREIASRHEDQLFHARRQARQGGDGLRTL